MSSGFARTYNSFAEFEREELRRLEGMNVAVDDLVEERFAEDLEMGGGSEAPRRRGRPRKNPR